MKTLLPMVLLALSCQTLTPGASSTSSFQFFDQLTSMSHRQFLVDTGRKRAASSIPRLRTHPALMTIDEAPVAQSEGTLMIWLVVSES